MYFANNTQPHIAFSISVLARYSSSPTRSIGKELNMRLHGTNDKGLFYSYESKSQLVGYINVGYLSDPHKDRFQTKIITIHEASLECF